MTLKLQLACKKQIMSVAFLLSVRFVPVTVKVPSRLNFCSGLMANQREYYLNRKRDHTRPHDVGTIMPDHAMTYSRAYGSVGIGARTAKVGVSLCFVGLHKLCCGGGGRKPED